MVNLQSGVHQQQDELSPDSLFSEEEIELISDCDRECFYHRSLPLSVISSIVTYWVIAGYIPNWGLWPAVIVGGLLGYRTGIFSYLDICDERLMQLQNSKLVAAQPTSSTNYGSDTGSDLD